MHKNGNFKNYNLFLWCIFFKISRPNYTQKQLEDLSAPIALANGPWESYQKHLRSFNFFYNSPNILKISKMTFDKLNI